MRSLLVIIWLALLPAVLLFMHFFPNELVYPKWRYDAIIFSLSFVVVPFLIFNIIRLFYDKRSYLPYKITAILAIVFLITSIISQEYQKKQELLYNGVETTGIVIGKKFIKGDNIQCRYFVKCKEYITYFHYDKWKSSIGDTLKITYNKDYPGIYEIEFEK